MPKLADIAMTLHVDREVFGQWFKRSIALEYLLPAGIMGKLQMQHFSHYQLKSPQKKFSLSDKSPYVPEGKFLHTPPNTHLGLMMTDSFVKTSRTII